MAGAAGGAAGGAALNGALTGLGEGSRMSCLRPIHRNAVWFDQVFAAKAAATGGVIRRKKADVDRKVGRERLELEVRRRGFHLIETADQFIIICDRSDIRLIC